MEHVQELLSEYLDRELPKEESRRVEDHLAGCPECRRELDELLSVSNLIHSLPKKPLPPGFMQRLERRRREAEAPGSSRFFLPVPARVAAFALSSFLVVFVVYQRLQSPPLPESSLVRSAEAPLQDGARAKKTAAASSAAPKALHGFSGAPLDEPAAAPPQAAYTNEALHQALESEKTRMGIRRILARSAPQATMTSFGNMESGASLGGGASLDAVRLPPPAPILPRNTPALLAASGRQDLAPAPSQEPPAALLIRSPQEQAKVWREKSLAASPPEVDYARQMLVLVFPREDNASVEITGTVQLPDRLIVRYREIPLSPQASTSYQSLVVPKNGLPVLFQRLP